jgi:steroid delta-isomerase-like uncharacterized protein
MDADALKETTRRWIIGIWDNADFSLIDELASADYVFRAEGDEEVRRAALREYVSSMRSAIPDLNNTIEMQVAEDDIVVTRGTTRGTHNGPFGDIPASGNPIVVPWVMFTRFKDGRIAEDYELYDAMSLMRQVGAIPEGS